MSLIVIYTLGSESWTHEVSAALDSKDFKPKVTLGKGMQNDFLEIYGLYVEMLDSLSLPRQF